MHKHCHNNALAAPLLYKLEDLQKRWYVYGDDLFIKTTLSSH